MILNRAKDYYENDKETLREKARDEYRNLLKKTKIKSENMEKTDIIKYLKKKTKTKRIRKEQISCVWRKQKQKLKEYGKKTDIIICPKKRNKN